MDDAIIGPLQAEEYDRQGFLVFDPGIDPATIEAAAAGVAQLYLPEDAPAERHGYVAYRDNRRIQDAWKVLPAVKAIALAPRVVALLRSLYGREPRAFQTLNFRMGSEQRPHSDTIHFNSRPAGYMCGVWVALEDIDADNGPVVYYPGTHKWPELDLRDVDAFPPALPRWRRLRRQLGRTLLGAGRDVHAEYLKYEKLVQSRLDASGIAPRYATIRKGQAFVWAANLIHGGSPQRDRSRTRASQVTHFFFEGCRYYTPLLARGWRTHWRRPEWVA